MNCSSCKSLFFLKKKHLTAICAAVLLGELEQSWCTDKDSVAGPDLLSDVFHQDSNIFWTLSILDSQGGGAAFVWIILILHHALTFETKPDFMLGGRLQIDQQDYMDEGLQSLLGTLL